MKPITNMMTDDIKANHKADLISGKSKRCGTCHNIPRVGSMPVDMYRD